MQKKLGKSATKVVDKCMQKLNNRGAKISRFGAQAKGGEENTKELWKIGRCKGREGSVK